MHSDEIEEDTRGSWILPSPPKWTTTLLSVLQKRKLKCHILSSQSPRFKTLLQRLEDDDEYFSEVSSNQPDIGLSRDVEKTLFEAFADNDFDDALHLLTVEEESDEGHESHVLGIVFWRDVPPKEMREWLNFSDSKDIDEVMRLLESVGEDEEDNDMGRPLSLLEKESNTASFPSIPNVSRKRQLSLVRQHSALSFQPLGGRDIVDHDHNNVTSSSPSSRPRSVKEMLSHAWIKIELLAVKKAYWGRRIGSLLLACCLYQAYIGNTIQSNPRTIALAENDAEEESNLILAPTNPGELISPPVPSPPPAQHCVLHVAGGMNNVPALNLYHRFGFLPASHLFTKPNKDLYVLGDIGQSLERLFYASNR